VHDLGEPVTALRLPPKDAPMPDLSRIKALSEAHGIFAADVGGSPR
jgi:hypothetical protein